MTLNPFSLEGRTAVVTGCGAGLGQAMAIGLAAAGADIIGVDRVGTAATEERVQETGRRYLEVVADISDISTFDEMVERCVSEYGSIDILVNNAGIIRRDSIFDFSEQDWDQVIDLNLKSVFFLSRSVAKRFVAQGRGGKIINIASMLSFQGGIRVPSYTASKSGILGLTRLLANELATHSINVNAIAPGYMETKATEALRQDPQREKEILDRIPAGRWGTPEDLQGAAVFLSSSASDYIHGYTIAVDGGWLAR